MMTPNEFRSAVLGKRYDVDGYYGSQCWDGYAYYMKTLGYPFASCTTTGYVKDIWNNRNINGMLNSCDVVTIMQQGDIAVFMETKETPYSHIALFMRDCGNQKGIFLGQNQGGVQGAFNEIMLFYDGILGAFRPKCFHDLFTKPVTKPEVKTVLNEIPSDFHYESATFRVKSDVPIKIRRAPSTTGEDTSLTYATNMSVVYDGYVVREGYVWISWISLTDGTRRWMACGKANTLGVNVEPWGTFQ